MFDGPQHLHPSWIAFSALMTLRALALPLIVVLVTGGGGLFDALGYGAAAIFIVVTLATRAVAWMRFTYEVTPEGLWVRSGVLSRTERLLPLDRIQSVDMNEPLFHRLLGMVEVKIESAAGGSSGSDVKLEALSRPVAAALRERLLVRSAPPVVGQPTAVPATESGLATEGDLLARVDGPMLVAAGATSARVGPALGGIFALFQFADDLLPNSIWGGIVVTAPNPTVQAIAAVVLAAALIAWLLAIATTILTFGGFELRRVEGRLQATYGLIERRRVSIPLARIQAVVISQGLLRQPFGLAALRAESAGYGRDTAESGVLMPIMRLRDVESLLARACPGFAIDPATIALERPPGRAWRRYVLGPLWGTLVAVVVASAVIVTISRVSDFSWLWSGLALTLAPLAVGLGWLAWRAAGWRLDERVFVVRAGSFDRITTVTNPRRLQHRSVRQNALQRRAGLATVAAAVASGGGGGRVEIAHLDERAAAALLDALGPATAAVPAAVPAFAAETAPAS